MARGFLSGAFWGATTGIVFAGIASVVAPLPGAPEIGVAAPQPAVVPTPSPPPSDVETLSATAADSPTIVQPQPAAPPASAPFNGQDGSAVAGALAQAGLPERPETGAAADLETPEDPADAGALELARDEPVLPSPQSLAPVEPNVATQPFVVTDSALPTAQSPALAVASQNAPLQPAPAAPAQADAAVDLPQDSTQGTTVVAALTPTPQAPAAPNLPRADEATATPPPKPVAPVPTPEADETAETAVPDANGATEAAVREAAQAAEVGEPLARETPQTPTLSEAEKPAQNPSPLPVITAQSDQPETATDASPTLPQGGTGVQQTAGLQPVVRSALGTPATLLTERSNGVTIRRPNTDAQQSGEASGTPAIQAAALDTATPLGRNALAFENASGKPLMSIVLIDDGSSVMEGRAGLAALGNFPYPLTFAVDTTLEDFEKRVATYRDADFEVMGLVDLPTGATPGDVETTFAVTLPKLEDVIGILEGVKGGLQSSRETSDQVTTILAQSGHGLVTQDKGLNIMPKLAVKEGVPAAPIFRDFDSKDQSARVIRRFLDQAAFKAGQQGSVIMMGRMRPDTITALLLWGLQDRAAQVSLAPISAVLRAAQ